MNRADWNEQGGHTGKLAFCSQESQSTVLLGDHWTWFGVKHKQKSSNWLSISSIYKWTSSCGISLLKMEHTLTHCGVQTWKQYWVPNKEKNPFKQRDTVFIFELSVYCLCSQLQKQHRSNGWQKRMSSLCPTKVLCKKELSLLAEKEIAYWGGHSPWSVNCRGPDQIDEQFTITETTVGLSGDFAAYRC